MTSYSWKKLFSLRGLERKGRSNSRRNGVASCMRPQVEQFEDRTVPAVLDLTGATTSGLLNGGLFELMNQQPAGSGVIDSFVRLHATGCCDTTPEGHNTSGRNAGSPKLNFDENSSPVFTHNLQLKDIPIVTIGSGRDAVRYREFRLDVNDPNHNPAVPVSLNKVKIFRSTSANLLASPTNLATLGTLVWDMDGNTASASTSSGADLDSAAPSANGNWVNLNDRNHGSGQADMRLLVPDSLFSGSGNQYIYFYSRFGDTNAMSGGFEEWYVGAAARDEAANVVTRIDRELPGGGEEQGPIGAVFNVPLGSTVHDHAFVTPVDGTGTPTGTVTFSFFQTLDCNGDSTDMTVPLGTQSSSQGPLHAGSYSFAARYSGDSNFAPGTAECEPLNVNKGTLTLTTVMHRADHTVVADGGHVDLGTEMHDNAILGGATPGFAPTGAVTFALTGPSSNTLLSLPGEAPGFYATSSNSLALIPGHYAFNVSYAGDSNYHPIASGAHNPETFVVDKGTLTLTTVMHTAADTLVADGSHVDLGTVMHDNAILGGVVPGFAPTGAVTFALTGPGGTVTLATLPTPEAGFYATSANTAALGAGNYAFNVSYAGDSNYDAIDSGAHDPETFVVDKANVQIRTEVHDSNHTDITNTIVLNGTQVHDKAFVTGQVGSFVIGGSVEYRFYNTTDCTGPYTSETVAVGAESSVITPSGGFHSYCASYLGDDNYNGAVGVPEPFTVLTRQPGHTPGFWQNQNGQALLTQADFAELTALNLVKEDGSAMDFTGSLDANKAALASWILADAGQNMAYKLSSFVATITLNINHGFNDGSGLVYCPSLIATYGPSHGFVGIGPGGAFLTLDTLLTLANVSLGTDPLTPNGHPERAYQNALHTILDQIANSVPLFLPV